MDCKLWNAGNGMIGCKQLSRAVATHNMARDTQVTIEPRIQKRTSVDLNMKLLPIEDCHVWPWLDVQTWGVGVRADDSNALFIDLRNVSPRNDGSVSDNESSFATRRGVNRWLIGDKALLAQDAGGISNNMVSRRGLINQILKR
jgi:hypothetical protein